MKPLIVAVIGATGLVGETLLRILAERRLPIADLRLFAGRRSSGTRVSALGREIEIQKLDVDEPKDFAAVDLAFFAADAETSRALAPKLAAQGVLVIDKSAAFRLDPSVPLVVPEVNGQALVGHNLVANPNCSTIPLAVMLGPIHQRFGLQWVSVATYQSVSGAGKDALDEFERQARGDQTPAKALPRRAIGNIFPENGHVDESGYGEEERKIVAELKKILSDTDVRVSATSVRVPVAVCHGEVVAFQTRERASHEAIAQILRDAPGVKFLEGAAYATPLEVAGTDDVAIGRLRSDAAHPGAFLAWVMSDNLRKGAATNAVQIAEVALAIRSKAAV